MEHSTKPPPSAGYPHPYPPPQYTANPVLLQPAAITQQPVHVVHIHQNPVVGPHPTMIICYNCHRNVLTRLEYEPSSKTHWLALGLCVFGLVPCALIPYCVQSCQNGNHYCPNCGKFIGTYTN